MQPFTHCLPRILDTGGVCSIDGAKGEMPIDPYRSLRLALQKAHMRNDKGRAGLQATANLQKGFKPLLDRDVVKRQKADGGIERSLGRDINVAPMKTDAVAVLSGDLPRQLQHVGGGVDAVESPARLCLGKGFKLQPATGAEDKNATVVRHALCHQQRRHPVQA